MPVSILLVLILLLGLGAGALVLQTKHSTKAFMTPGQYDFVSAVGVVAFAGLTFAALKMLFT